MKDGTIPGGTPPGTEVKHEAPGNSNAADPGMDIAKAELALTAARAAHMQRDLIEGLEIDLQIRKDRQPVIKTPISSRLQAATSESNQALHQREAASKWLAELKQKVREADQLLEKATQREDAAAAVLKAATLEMEQQRQEQQAQQQAQAQDESNRHPLDQMRSMPIPQAPKSRRKPVKAKQTDKCRNGLAALICALKGATSGLCPTLVGALVAGEQVVAELDASMTEDVELVESDIEDDAHEPLSAPFQSGQGVQSGNSQVAQPDSTQRATTNDFRMIISDEVADNMINVITNSPESGPEDLATKRRKMQKILEAGLKNMKGIPEATLKRQQQSQSQPSQANLPATQQKQKSKQARQAK